VAVAVGLVEGVELAVAVAVGAGDAVTVDTGVAVDEAVGLLEGDS
jgi:hypothetical protein